MFFYHLTYKSNTHKVSSRTPLSINTSRYTTFKANVSKNLDRNNLHFYAAAYEMTDDGSSNLNTNLTDAEKNAINAVFLSVISANS